MAYNPHFCVYLYPLTGSPTVINTATQMENECNKCIVTYTNMEGKRCDKARLYSRYHYYRINNCCALPEVSFVLACKHTAISA